MNIKITPHTTSGFQVAVDPYKLGKPVDTGIVYRTYKGAVRAVNAIVDDAYGASPVVIDYHECLARTEG